MPIMEGNLFIVFQILYFFPNLLLRFISAKTYISTRVVKICNEQLHNLVGHTVSFLGHLTMFSNCKVHMLSNSRAIEKDKLERASTEVVVIYFNTLFHHVPGKNEDIKNPFGISCNRFPNSPLYKQEF
jgi:hypothetical protein